MERIELIRMLAEVEPVEFLEGLETEGKSGVSRMRRDCPVQRW